MRKDTRNVLVRIGVVAAIVGAVALVLLWRTWTVRDFEEIQPGVLYRASVANNDEFVATALKLEPHGLVTIGSSEEQQGPTLAAAHEYGFRNHLRVWELDVPPGKMPTTIELQRLREYLAKERNHPTLMVALDPIRGGMVAAAYRLSDLRMPLSEVEKSAGKGSKDPTAADTIRVFAQQWAKAPIPPATQPDEGSATPAGPLLPQ